MSLKIKKGFVSDLYLEISPGILSNESKLGIKHILDQNGIQYNVLSTMDQEFPYEIKCFVNLDSGFETMKEEECQIFKEEKCEIIGEEKCGIIKEEKCEIIKEKEAKKDVEDPGKAKSSLKIKTGIKTAQTKIFAYFQCKKPESEISSESNLAIQKETKSKMENKTSKHSIKGNRKPLLSDHRLTIFYINPDILGTHWTKLLKLIADIEQKKDYDTMGKGNNKPRMILLFQGICAYQIIPKKNSKLKKLQLKLKKFTQTRLSRHSLKNANSDDKDTTWSDEIPKGLDNIQNNMHKLQFKTKEDFEDWLMNITTISDVSIDYKITHNMIESQEYLMDCMAEIIHSKYRNTWDRFDFHKINKKIKAKNEGIIDEYSLAWIDILMTIPGISEEKAISIVKKYPTLKCLKDAYDDILDIYQQQKMLENLNVIYKYSQKKNLGKAFSKKLFKVFNSQNCSEYL